MQHNSLILRALVQDRRQRYEAEARSAKVRAIRDRRPRRNTGRLSDPSPGSRPG